MTGHRRTPNRRGIIPPGWAFIAALVLCVVAAGGIGVLLLQSGDDTAAPVEPTNSQSTPTATPTPTEVTTATPTPTPTPTEVAVERTMHVSVLNNTAIQGLAARFAVEVEQAGWTVGGVGGWNGQIVSNTVYYPPGYEDQAEQLASDVGIDRIMPRVGEMRTDRLTIILSGPQE